MDDRGRLEAAIASRIRTTMVGSIDAIEKKMSFLWSKDDEDGNFMYKVFQDVRKTILDNGNAQIKLSKTDIDNYEIEHKVYHTVFPTIKQERLRGNG